MTITDYNNSIIAIPDRPINALRNFKLPKLTVRTNITRPDRKTHRNKLKLSMSIIPPLKMERLDTYDEMYYRTDSAMIIDGIDVRRLHANIPMFDISTIQFMNFPNILFIDHHHHEYTFWNDTLHYINEIFRISAIFMNVHENHNLQYYQSENTIRTMTRDHLFMQTILIALMANQLASGLVNGKYVVVDKITNSLQQIDEIRELIYNGRHYKIGQLYRITHDTKIRPELRSNFDFIILNPFHVNNYNLHRIYQSYFAIFPTFDIFRTLVEELRRNREFVIINARHNSHNIYDRMFRIPLNDYSDVSFEYRQQV